MAFRATTTCCRIKYFLEDNPKTIRRFPATNELPVDSDDKAAEAGDHRRAALGKEEREVTSSRR